jgi:hypothetical protein
VAAAVAKKAGGGRQWRKYDHQRRMAARKHLCASATASGVLPAKEAVMLMTPLSADEK